MKLRAYLPAVAFACLAIPAFPSVAAAEEAVPTLDFPAYDPAAIDPTVDPCVDFYAHACGGWRKNHPMPPDVSSWSRPWSQYAREVDEVLRALVEWAAAGGKERSPDEQKVGDYFAACMDVDTLGARGLEPLAADLAAIDGLRSIADLPTVLGNLQRGAALHDTEAILFVLLAYGDPEEGGQRLTLSLETGWDLGLPSRENYLDESERQVKLRAAYQGHIGRMLHLLGASESASEDLAAKVLALETALAEARLSASVLRNDAKATTNLWSPEELAQLTPRFSWTAYFRALGLPEDHRINISQPDYLRRLDELLAATPLATWQAFLRFHLVSSQRTSLLPTAIREAHFEFYGRKFFGREELPERWRTCIDQVDSALPEALSRVFVEHAWDPELGERTIQLFEAIRAAFARRIENAPWLAPETKRQALEKLAAVRLSVGAPQQWFDDPRLVIRRDDAFGNARRAAESARRASFHGLGEPVSLDDWGRPPTWVGGYYTNAQNAIVMTAAQLLYFADGLDDPGVLYGGLGVFLGHELSHGFDSLGRNYDAQGHLKDWWTKEDGERFQAQARCVAEQFSTYEFAPGVPVNGDLVISEQTAELVGWVLAWDAFESLWEDGPIDRDAARRFFLSSAQVVCFEATPDTWRAIAAGDSHAFGAPGIHGTVTNMPSFAQTFGCEEGQPMVKPEEELCVVW